MNKDLQTEYEMVMDRAVFKEYNKMSYFDGVKHLIRSWLFTRSKLYKEIISRREAGIFREWQVSKLAIRGKEVKKADTYDILKYFKKLDIKEYIRNMWFGWSVHWSDKEDKRFLVMLRFHVYHLFK